MNKYIIAKSITFEPAKFSLLFNKKNIKLNQKETEVLHLLCKTPQHVVGRKSFLKIIWDDREGGDIHLNKSILTLRRKFESMGYSDSIDTISRVGYLFRLDVAVHQFKEEDEGITKVTSLYIAKNLLSNRVTWPILFTVITPLIYTLYQLDNTDETNSVAYTTKYESSSLNIIEMDNITYQADYKKLISKLSQSPKKYISLSNLAMTIIEEINDDKDFAVVYIFDQTQDINKQLLCISENANIGIAPSHNNLHDIDNNPSRSNGAAIQKRLFYSPCINGSTEYIGTLFTRLSYYSRAFPRKDAPSSWLQKTYFHNASGDLVFDIQQIYRANHIIKENNNTNFLVKLNQKSIKINHADQDIIEGNNYIKMIFNECERDHMYARSIKYDKRESVLMLSSMFNGSLTKARLKKA